MTDKNTKQTEPRIFQEAREFWKHNRGKFKYFFANGYCPNGKETWIAIYLYCRCKAVGMAAKKLTLEMPVENVYKLITGFLIGCVEKIGEMSVEEFNENHRRRYPGKEFSDLCTKAQTKAQAKPPQISDFTPHPSPNAVKGKDTYTRAEVDALLLKMKSDILLEIMSMDAPIL